MNSINTKRNLSCCGCMAVVFLLLLYFCLQKEGTFLDELLTYDLSNRHSPRVEFIVSHLTHNPPSVLINDLQDILENGKENSRIYKDFKSWEQTGMETSVWHQPTYFASFLEVEKGSRFDFLSVLYNSIYNSSPPLYYHLVHLIVSKSIGRGVVAEEQMVTDVVVSVREEVRADGGGKDFGTVVVDE